MFTIPKLFYFSWPALVVRGRKRMAAPRVCWGGLQHTMIMWMVRRSPSDGFICPWLSSAIGVTSPRSSASVARACSSSMLGGSSAALVRVALCVPIGPSGSVPCAGKDGCALGRISGGVVHVLDRILQGVLCKLPRPGCNL